MVDRQSRHQGHRLQKTQERKEKQDFHLMIQNYKASGGHEIKTTKFHQLSSFRKADFASGERRLEDKVTSIEKVFHNFGISLLAAGIH